MTLALVIGGSMIFGAALAEIWHRFVERHNLSRRKRDALVAEFMENQLWQFVSLDEWLKTTTQQEKWYRGELLMQCLRTNRPKG